MERVMFIQGKTKRDSFNTSNLRDQYIHTFFTGNKEILTNSGFREFFFRSFFSLQ